MSWEQLDDPPNWIVEVARQERRAHVNGEGPEQLFGTARIHHGDTYVYKIEYGIKNHGHDYTFYRQLKSDYFETTPQEGTCPNCQAYVKRYDDDDYLTCHRCGWQYKPLTERIRNLL